MKATRNVSLASLFQEVLTAIVRVRFRLHTVVDGELFRKQFRQLLQTAMQQARSAGYDNAKIQGSVFASVAMLDESILNLQDPAFSQWARRPLQEELFGGHLAGETFFHNLRTYLAEQDSPQLADVLELHCLCLALGYRGRYALGDTGELFDTLRHARSRIDRIRGGATLPTRITIPSLGVSPVRRRAWTLYLLWTTCALACLVLIGYVTYNVMLSSGMAALHAASSGYK